MSVSEKTDIEAFLTNGWKVVGYSIGLLSGGQQTHNILLQKELSLKTVIVLAAGDNELGRNAFDFSPNPVEEPKKKRGFWG